METIDFTDKTAGSIVTASDINQLKDKPNNNFAKLVNNSDFLINTIVSSKLHGDETYATWKTALSYYAPEIITFNYEYLHVNNINKGYKLPVSNECYIRCKSSLPIDTGNNVHWQYTIVTEGDNPPKTGRIRAFFLGDTQQLVASYIDKVHDGIYIVRGHGTVTAENVYDTMFECVYDEITPNVYVTDFRLAITDSNIYTASQITDNYNDEVNELSAAETSAMVTNSLVASSALKNAINSAKISKFILDYSSRNVDSFNQLSIVLTGDSILGHLDTIVPDYNNPQMELTPDMNDIAETNPAYITGHHAPNMWEQNIAYKLLQQLQYSNADVKYFNQASAEVSTTGTWGIEPLAGLDNIPLTYTTEDGASIQMSFTGAKFIKFIKSVYFGGNASTFVDIEFSIDNITYNTPESFGLLCSKQTTGGTDGRYLFVSNRKYKFGGIKYSGFDELQTYYMRVTRVSGGSLTAWGFETWSNNRINVVVNAEGGSTASIQVDNLYRFSNESEKYSLNILNIPIINDFGVSLITNYKGIANLSTSPSAPVEYDFYYASVEGVYTNFNNLALKEGDYFEYNGGSWIYGSTTLSIKLNEYKEDLEIIFETISLSGVPTIILLTHNATSYINYRMYIQNEAMSIAKSIAMQYHVAIVDVMYNVNNDNVLADIVADGIHLNDAGVAYYVSKILPIVEYKNIECCASSEKSLFIKRGTLTGGDSLNLGFDLNTIPTVRVYNNSTITVVPSVTGFTSSGTGDFDYELFLD